jgi:hypothetical protein
MCATENNLNMNNTFNSALDFFLNNVGATMDPNASWFGNDTVGAYNISGEVTNTTGWDANTTGEGGGEGGKEGGGGGPTGELHHETYTIVLLSLLFFVIVLVGILGNALVIIVVLTDRKMRQSVTNLLILNLALADLVIMMLGVPEITMVMINRGYLLGPVACRLTRFLLVVCVYASVMSLVSVCFER